MEKNMAPLNTLIPVPLQTQRTVPSRPILVIEQNDRMAELLAMTLQMYGYSMARYAGNASRFIDLPKTMPAGPCPALILLDLNEWNVPRENISGTIEMFRTCWQDCSIIPAILVITTSIRIQECVQACGYRAVLQPFKSRVLCEVIREELGSKVSS
jgi:DNA-binding response OmpR family regulator